MNAQPESPEAAGNPGSAAETPLIPRRILFGSPDRTPARLSPDGAWLAWLAPRHDLLNVFVCPVGDLSRARPVTDERKQPIADFSWSPDSTMILYPRDADGDENDHLMCVRVDGGGAAVDLTPFPGAKTGILMSSHRHKNRLLIGVNNRDPQYFDVHELVLPSGELRPILQNDGYAGFLADTALALRVAMRPRPDGGVDYFRVSGGEPENEPFERIDYEDSRNTMPIGFSDDRTKLYWVDARGRDKAAVVAQELASGCKTVLAADEHADIDGILVDPTTVVPMAYHVNYLTPRYAALDPALQPDFDFLDAHLDGTWSVVSQSDANDLWTLVNDPVTASPAAYLYARGTRTLQRLYAIRPELDDAPLVSMEPMEIRSRDGLTLVSYLSLPAGVGFDKPAASPLPLVLDVHGGPWSRDVFGYNAAHQWLANRGYAVMSVNFRGSLGFGKAFVNAGDGEWGARMQHDLLDAVDAVVQRGLADPGKVAIFGGSYGGYAVLAGLAFTPKVFACGVDIVGPSQLSTLLASIPPYWVPLRAMFHRAIGDPETIEGQTLLEARSPLTKAHAIERPLLIGQGANDPRVKQAESDQIAAALAANGTPLTYILYPDEGHGFERPANRIAFYAIAENFLATYLGGRAEAIGDALDGSSTVVRTGAEHVPGLAAAAQGHGVAT